MNTSLYSIPEELVPDDDAPPPFSKPCPPAPSRPRKCDLSIYDLYIDFPLVEDLDSLATSFDFDKFADEDDTSLYSIP
jgi:hypothetical protein